MSFATKPNFDLQSHPNVYYNVGGVLSKEWRRFDSFFALISDEEDKECLEKISILMREGTFFEKLDYSEKKRIELGTSTFLIGQKI